MRQIELHYPSCERPDGCATAGYEHQPFFYLLVPAMGPKTDDARHKYEKGGKSAYLMHPQIQMYATLKIQNNRDYEYGATYSQKTG